MSVSDFTAGQRRVVVLMIVVVVASVAMLAGFVVTSLRTWESPLPTATSSFTPLPSSTPASLPPDLPAPSPSAFAEEGIWSQVQAARLFDQIAHQVKTLRGLTPRAEVPLSFLDEQTMNVLLRRLHTGRDSETGGQLRPYTALGLLPDVSLSIQAHQVAGIYVPEEGQLYVAIGQQRNGVDDQAVLAHAYTHALQDQRFDLGAMDARAVTTDARLAVQALVEGDATLLTALYRYGDLSATDWESLTELIVRAEQPEYGKDWDLLESWERLRRFPYWEGRRFAYALFQVGGWEVINRAYTDPPRSTEQVLHPERYLEERDEIAPVTVPLLDLALGEGWTMLLQDTLGELVIGLYLEALLSPEMAWQAAEGWGGDTFVVWQHEDGRRVLVWRTIWDRTAEAAEFERALVAMVPQRYLPSWPVDPSGDRVGSWWEGHAGATYVFRAARYVTFVHGPDLATVADVVEVLP